MNPSNNRTLGNIGETNIRRDLSRKGYIVADNDECDKSDLLVKRYVDGGASASVYVSLQSKYAGSHDNVGTVSLITSSGRDDTRVYGKYTRGDCDVFGLDFTDTFGKIAYIPYVLVQIQPSETLTIRITPPFRKNAVSAWCIWDFLSFEKARLCKDPSDYKMRFQDSTDEVFLKEWNDLEKHIQYKWEQCCEKSPYDNPMIRAITVSQKQYPNWFRAQFIHQINWSQFGEDPIVLSGRIANTTKIRQDLKNAVTPKDEKQSAQFFET